MATGYIGMVSGAGTLSYTATTTAKVIVVFTAGSSGANIAINGGPSMAFSSTVANVNGIQLPIYLSAGATVTISSTGVTQVWYVTALEE